MEEQTEIIEQPGFKVGEEVVVIYSDYYGYDVEGYGQETLNDTNDFAYPVIADEDKLEVVSIDWEPKGFIYNLENNEGWRVWGVSEDHLSI